VLRALPPKKEISIENSNSKSTHLDLFGGIAAFSKYFNNYFMNFSIPPLLIFQKFPLVKKFVTRFLIFFCLE
jgi:hypothetical protein